MRCFSVIVLTVSLAGNVLLAFHALRVRAEAEEVGARSARASGAGSRSTANEATKAGPSQPASPWLRLVGDDDLEGLVARLRASGCPPHILRAIVGDEISQRQAPQRATLAADFPSQPFWSTKRGSSLTARELSVGLRRLNRERAVLLRSLLGADAADSDEFEIQRMQHRMAPLPPEKLEAVTRIQADYADLRMEARPEGGVILPEDRERQDFLAQEERGDLAAVLTPAELLEYDLRSHPNAHTLRLMLMAFQPSEDEFRRIFAAVRDTGDSRGIIGYSAQLRHDEAQLAAVRKQLRDDLSPERVEELEIALDPRLATTNRLLARLQLPITTARDISAVQEDITKRASAIRADRAFSAADRAMQLSALEREATSRLAEMLGASGVEAYKSYGGSWLRTLGRTPSPTRPRP